MRRLSLFIASVVLCAAPLRAEDRVNFGRDILPILSNNCYLCHGPDEGTRQTELRLDLEESAKEVHDGAAAVTPGDRAASEVFRRIASSDADMQMPPADSNRSLTPEQIELIGRWIDEGAEWGQHWSFEPIERPAVPPSQNEFVENEIDAFVLQRLSRENLTPNEPAARETLIRRVSLDLTGLPPTPEDVDVFLADDAPGAYERLVDRLLSSPAFGERMSWEWLDAARYADSNGYQGDNERTMWPWRDWVADAFNRNLPYDEFTVWQLAGDLLPNSTHEQTLATGFCRNHMINGEGGRIPDENRADYVMDMAETTGTVWLGLTFNCCRCHDHKFDPLSQRDYYGLFAFFNQTPVDGGGGNPQTPPILETPTEDQKARRSQLNAALDAARGRLDAFEQTFLPRGEGQTAADSPATADAPEAIREILKQPVANRNSKQFSELEKHFAEKSPEYAELLRAAATALDERNDLENKIPRVMVMADRPEARETFILDKGLYNKPGEAVTAAVPAELPSMADGQPVNRLGLANWIVAPENPLTARVTVNRFWQQFFGVGLVKTPADFGVQGERPVHPELLDWLAAEFIASGWDVKHLCRLIVTSGTYRQSSKVTSDLVERDPENRLLGRGPRHRMPSWMIRDQALAASGLLVRDLGGPPVKPYQPEGVWEEISFGNKKYVQDHGAALYRRSLYTFWRRIVGPTMFFDTAARQTCVVTPVRTNTPLHALATLNDTTYVEAARVLAERVITTAGSQPGARIESAFRLVLARLPKEAETRVLLESADRLTREFSADPDAASRLLSVGEAPRDERLDPVEHAAWTGVCSAILNLDEAVTKE